MASKYEKKSREMVVGMEPWWRDVASDHAKNAAAKNTDSRDGRTPVERTWDSGVFAASELVRRLTGDEHLSLAIHELCFWARKEREKNPNGKL